MSDAADGKERPTDQGREHKEATPDQPEGWRKYSRDEHGHTATD